MKTLAIQRREGSPSFRGPQLSCTPKFVDLVYIVIILGEKNGSGKHSHYFILSLEENLDLRSGKVFYYNSMKIFVDLEPQLLFYFVRRSSYTSM